MSETKPLGDKSIRNNGIIQPNPSEHLSQLLEHYLALLDQYQSLQVKLSKLLSSGYISLAETNFLSSERIRYGQDFYDERMQATKLLRINFPSGEDSFVPSFELAQPGQDAPKPESKTNLVSDNVSPPLAQQRASNDPLHWFGILVPPALRTAQREFIGAVDVLPKLAQVISQMDSYERKIEEARKDGNSQER
ncbi:MAG: hypothetical protein M1813_008125 [Trichoglossum hirsutum]|nr:MAG: hypothetical protein M1813_008125 [Trichoglossum hirsutum]